MNETELRLECLKLAQQGLSQAGLTKPRTVPHTEILQYAEILLEWVKRDEQRFNYSDNHQTVDYAEIMSSERNKHGLSTV